MRLRSIYPVPALIAAVGFLGTACIESPTGSTPDSSTPNFSHKPGHDKGGGDGGGGGKQNYVVEFLDGAVGGTSTDYVSDPQSGRGNNSKRKFEFTKDPYRLVLRFDDELALDGEVCVVEHGEQAWGTPNDDFLATLQSASDAGGGLDGELAIIVWWDDDPGAIVNFTVTVGGEEYFVTTAGANRTAEALEGGVIKGTNEAGWLRIVNGDEDRRCRGILEYDFVASPIQ